MNARLVQEEADPGVVMRIGVRLTAAFVVSPLMSVIGLASAGAQTIRYRYEERPPTSTYRYEQRSQPRNYRVENRSSSSSSSSSRWAWSNAPDRTYILPDIWPGSYIGATVGAGAGLIVGNAWRTGNFLAGAELEGQFRTGSAVLAMSAPSNFDSLNWSWAGRVRAGFLLHPRFYFYGMGGVALVNYDYKDAGGVIGSGSRGGLQLGGGVEWKVLDQLSLRLDYTSTRLDWGSALSSTPHDRNLNALQLGVMFRF